MAYTWTELLDKIKVRGMIPTAQNTFTEARLLAIADSAMRTKIVPSVNKVQENYYSYDVDTAVNATGIYPINKRAAGCKLEDISFISGNQRIPANEYDEVEISDYTLAPGADGFYIKRNTIYTLPTVPAISYLRQSFIMRPNSFVPQTSAAQITAINTGTKTVTCTTVPAAWTAASILDIVQAGPHFDWLCIDQVVTAVVTGASGTIAFSSALPSSLAVGDWVSLAGETPVIQCPVEFHDLLAQEAANICLRGQTDAEALKDGILEAKELRTDLLTMLSPRVEKKGKTIVNRTGILRRGL